MTLFFRRVPLKDVPRSRALPALNGEHIVYRAFDHDGTLLYVGVTSHFFSRMGQHEQGSDWWPRVARFKVESYPDRKTADRREIDLIEELRPPHNTTNTGRRIKRADALDKVPCRNTLLGCKNQSIPGEVFCRRCWNISYKGEPPGEPDARLRWLERQEELRSGWETIRIE